MKVTYTDYYIKYTHSLFVNTSRYTHHVICSPGIHDIVLRVIIFSQRSVELALSEFISQYQTLNRDNYYSMS